MEIKTSFFIHPSKPAGDGNYYFTYSQNDEGDDLYLYTSHEEYLKCHGDNDEVEPNFLYFNDLYDALYTEMNGIIINPSTDNFTIPVWLAFLSLKILRKIMKPMRILSALRMFLMTITCSISIVKAKNIQTIPKSLQLSQHFNTVLNNLQ